MDPLVHLNASLQDRYRVERELGAGGMATVYLARDLRHNRRVALKVLRPDLGVVLGSERFFAEIEVTANLQHPNLLPLFDSGEADGKLFYVMPYVEGESLRARLDREKQLPVDEAIRIATSVASALDYAHRHGVVHRDLKPENILLHEGQPLVADFGIALAVSNAGGGRITQTGVSLGTPQYMSPEQATGDRVIDARTDVYSLGAVTYEMLTGEPPHVGTTSQAVIARLLTENPRLVRATRPNVPEHVERAVARALEKLPADRLATAQEFADALTGRVLVPAGAPTLQLTGPGAAGRPRPTALGVVRHPVGAALAVLAALGVVGTVGLGWAARPETPRPTVRFELGFGEEHGWSDGVGSPFALSPDGTLVAYAGTTGSGVRQLYVRPLGELRARELAGTEGAQMPFFSPDGRWIGYESNGRLFKVLVTGSTPVFLSELSQMLGATWAPGDRIVASMNGRLVVVPAAGGAAEVVAGVQGDPERGVLAAWPLALPDGKTVLYTLMEASTSVPRIAAARLDGGDGRSLDLPGGAALAVLDGLLVYAAVEGAIMAVPFDAARLRTSGTPAPVLDGVNVGLSGALKGAVSTSGSVVYVTGDAGGTSELLAAAPGAAPTALVGERGTFAHPRYSPDGRHLAFARGGGRGTDVWILDLPAGPLRRLTTEGTLNDRPEWTPDSRAVLFRSNRSGQNAFWIQPADGNRPAEPYVSVEDGAVDEAVLSSDGEWLVVQIDTTRCNCVGTSYYRRVRGDTALVSIAGPIPGQHTTARMSPDGRWIAYRSNETGAVEVYAKPFPALDARVQVSLAGGEQPVWSPDGRRLYYLTAGGSLVAATLGFSPTMTVLARDTVLDGPNTNPIPPTSRNHANYDVAPDGRTFVFVSGGGSDATVVVVHDWITELQRRMSPPRDP